MHPSPQRLIVCERTSDWAVALRRALGDEVDVASTRSLAECRRELAAARESLVVVELTVANATRVAEFVAWAQERMTPTLVVVVAARELAPYEIWLREAGAVHFVASPRRLGELRELVRRQQARYPGLRRSFQDELWAKLPWPEGAPGAPTTL